MSALLQNSEDERIGVSACALIRQLAKSDDIKKLFISMDGLDAVERILRLHKQSIKVCSQVGHLNSCICLSLSQLLQILSCNTLTELQAADVEADSHSPYNLKGMGI
jgi:hypothetical protein